MAEKYSAPDAQPLQRRNSLSDMTAAASAAAARSTKFVSDQTAMVLEQLDQIGDGDPAPKTVQGFLLTFAAMALLIAYTVIESLKFRDAPFPKSAELKWTVVDGPIGGVGNGPLFPMNIVCQAASGCLLALSYSGQRGSSANCRAATAAAGAPLQHGQIVSLLNGEAVTTFACYTDNPEDGLFAYHNGTSPFGVGVTSIGFVAGDPVALDVPIRAGRTLFNLVNTTNHTTVGFGYVRYEWYPSLLGVTLVDTSVAELHNVTSQYATQLFIDAQWTSVEVDQKDLLQFISTVGGTWTLLLTVGALTLYFYQKSVELYTSPSAKRFLATLCCIELPADSRTARKQVSPATSS